MKELSNKIIELIEQARHHTNKFVNMTMVHTYFHIGKVIVDELQEGKERAAYGKNLLKNLSLELCNKYGKGFSVQNLENMRNFYNIYQSRLLPDNPLNNNDLESSEKSQSLIRNFENITQEKSQSVVRKFNPTNFNLSWTHYLILIKIENEYERMFYEVEATNEQWSVRELRRQVDSCLFERLALSRDKEKVIELAKKGQTIARTTDVIKDPLVLEFLGLEEKTEYSETDLETAIINQIEKFMLELGKGFFFGGRQVRFTFDEEHYRVDLVFYNRLLKCFVLIDLKIGKLTHQDLGQMQMYVNYYDRFIKADSENPTIGIIVCKHKNRSIIEITLPEDNNQIFAAKYQTIIPQKQDFIKLLEQYNE